MLAPSEAPGSMQALEVAGLEKPEPTGWWQWLTGKLHGGSARGYERLEEAAGPSDKRTAEGIGLPSFFERSSFAEDGIQAVPRLQWKM